jgi:hypothetical protein
MFDEADMECCTSEAMLGGTHREWCGEEVVEGGGAGISGLDSPTCGGTSGDDICEANMCFGDVDMKEFPGLDRDLSGALLR